MQSTANARIVAWTQTFEHGSGWNCACNATKRTRAVWPRDAMAFWTSFTERGLQPMARQTRALVHWARQPKAEKSAAI